jgi:shikimate dehydrogenase
MFRCAGVVGWPARHSRSPLVHGFWLAEHGLSGAYLRIEASPETAQAILWGLAGEGLVGANVTVPHKELALGLADEADELARRLGAANLLWVGERGVLHAANTDVAGFLGNLDEGAPGWDAEAGTALVLGAGGAARAVALGLASRGFRRVVVANRTVARAEALARVLGDPVEPLPLAEAERALPEASLVVNTTTLGMKGEGGSPIGLSHARPDAIVTDAVYVPLETPLLAAARARGLKTVDGLGMLLHQAVPTFERLFGVRPEVTPALRRLVEADLGVSR